MSNDARPVHTAIAEHEEHSVPKKSVFAWAMWDWATQPFNSVILTFVFTALYLTTEDFLDPKVAALGEDGEAYEHGILGLTSPTVQTSNPYHDGIASLTSGLGLGLTVAGILVAILAPVLGQRADAAGTRKRWLGVSTGLLVLSMVGLFWVQPSTQYFWLGVALIAAGSVFSEIAGVNYNAMLPQVSTSKTVGRVSGLGWGLGYVGGIVALIVVVVLTTFDWFGMDTSNGMAFRIIALGSAAWTVLFGWLILVFVPEAPTSHRPKVSIWSGYLVLWRDLRKLWRNARSTLWFLLASAVYRDGLAGVFAFGAVIAAVAFGFSDENVMIFGIAANLVAGISTILVGLLDDRLGPRKVILGALALIVVAGIAIVALHSTGDLVFWVGGLLLSACVGPAQSASRSLLTRVTPAGQEAEIFGLYATTGRAVSFLAPFAWWAAIKITGETIWGTAGIVAVVAIGLGLLAFVRTPADRGASV